MWRQTNILSSILGKEEQPGLGLKGRLKGRALLSPGLYVIAMGQDRHWLGVMGPLSLSLAFACDRRELCPLSNDGLYQFALRPSIRWHQELCPGLRATSTTSSRALPDPATHLFSQATDFRRQCWPPDSQENSPAQRVS